MKSLQGNIGTSRFFFFFIKPYLPRGGIFFFSRLFRSTDFLIRGKDKHVLFCEPFFFRVVSSIAFRQINNME